MSTINENKSSNFLRTQSYIANGMPNPTFKASHKDYLSNIIKSKYSNKLQNKSKTKTNKNKNYINDVKKKKTQKKTSFNKPSQKKLLKKYINNKLEEKTEIINHKKNDKYSRNSYIYNTKTEKFKNIDENCLYSKTYHHTIKDNNAKKLNGKENNKNALNIRNKRNYNNHEVAKNNEINKSNGLHKSNTFSSILNDDFFCKTTKGRNSSRFDFTNIVNQTKIGIMTTKANINRSRNKEFRRDIDNIYSMTYRSKLKKNPKGFNSGKVKKFVNKILSNNEDDYLNVKNHKNKNILLNKLNHYTKREKNDFEDNKTQRGLLTIKNLVNRKINLFSPKITNNKMYNIPTNLFQCSYSNYKQYNDYLNNYSNKVNSKKNAIYPVLTEYNNKNNHKKNDSSTDLFKIKMSKSFSNILNSIQEQRKTNKFIKDLNKNKSFRNKPNKHIKFTFSSDKDEDESDEFYSPNRSKINNIRFKDMQKLSNNKKINYFIKKNISSDNFRRNPKKKNNKINYNSINIKITNFINKFKERKHIIMPVNEAIN